MCGDCDSMLDATQCPFRVLSGGRGGGRHINGSELLYVGGGLCCSVTNEANRGKEI